MDDATLTPWLHLLHLQGISPRLYLKLLEVYGGAEPALAADPEELRRAGVSTEVVEALAEYRRLGASSRAARRTAQALRWRQAAPAHHLLCLADPRYPEALAAIPEPPPLLFVVGRPEVLRESQLAMVGSRRPTAGGRRLARRFAGGLGAEGFTITSGMALGIDRESHLGALEQDRPTVAVLGSGIDQLFPRRNLPLARRIPERGALVSEFPLGTPPSRWNFPRRNRIISGLSKGVLVVEAASRSGSLITARYALEQGREVFALPGAVDNPMSRGCHLLIREGAALVETVDDVLAELGLLSPAAARPPNGTRSAPRVLPDAEQRLLAEIGHDQISADALAAATGLPPGPLAAALVQLELLGLIEQGPRGYLLRPG